MESELPVFLIFVIIILIPCIGGFIVGLGVWKVSVEAKGHGIPNVMKAMYVDNGKIRARVPVAKFILSTLTIGTGSSAGSEGPIAQVGAGLGSYIGYKLKINQREMNILIATGAASAIGAVFNAPLGGVLFGLEILLSSITLRSVIPVIVGTATAITSNTILLNNYESVFLVPQYEVQHSIEFLFFIILGIIIGFSAVIWQTIFVKTEHTFDNMKFPLYYRTALGGLGVGIILYFSSLELRGSSYGLIQKALLGYDYLSKSKTELYLLMITLIVFAFLKIILTSITLGSGSSGGVFSPSLLIGALIGAAFGILLSQLFPSLNINPGLYAVLGMASLFGSVARAPLTMIIISTEMSGEYTLFPVLMITVATSYIIHNAVLTESIYTEPLQKYGVSTRFQSAEDYLAYQPISQIMHPNCVCIYEDSPISVLPDIFSSFHHRGFVVVDRQHYLAGIVTTTDFQNARIKGITNGVVGDIMTREVVTTRPNDCVQTALDSLFKNHYGRVPITITDTAKNKQIPIGMLTRTDIVNMLESMYGMEYYKENQKIIKHKEKIKGMFIQSESCQFEQLHGYVVILQYDWLEAFEAEKKIMHTKRAGIWGASNTKA